MSKYYIFSSDIATFIGQNRWNIISPFERLWRKVDKQCLDLLLESVNNDLEEENVKMCHLKTQINELEEQFKQKKITHRQLEMYKGKINEQLNGVEKKAILLHDNIDGFTLSQNEKIQKEFGEELTNILKDLTISNDDKKKMTMEMINNSSNTNSGHSLSNKKKDEYKSEIESLVNKSHGIRHELSAIELFEKENNCSLDTSQQFYKRLVYTSSKGNQWYICGKMDGINHEEHYIVEIKNRTKAFFNQVRDYEKTQIQMYMYMTDLKLTKLVECKKTKTKTTIKTTDISYDEIYISDVLTKLQNFLIQFENFISSNVDEKKKYLLMDNEEKEWFIHNMYHSKSIRETNQSKNSKETTEICLLDSSDSDSLN